MSEYGRKIDCYCVKCGQQMTTWDAKLVKAFKSYEMCEDCFLKIYDKDRDRFRDMMKEFFGLYPCKGI